MRSHRGRSADRAGLVGGYAAAFWLGLLAAGLAGPAGAQSVCTSSAINPTVRFATTLGDVDVLLCRADVQATVDNFLQYVSDGAYTSSGFIHRSVQSSISVVQGGGAWIDADGVMRFVEARAPIALEAGLPNVRGTIAMARSSMPDTAASQWFFNVQDNPSLDPIDSQSPGYAVFGEVVAGLSVLDDVASQTIWALNPGFLAEVPLIAYPDDGSSPTPYLVYVTDVRVVPEPAAALQVAAAVGTLAALAAARRRRAA